MRYFGANLYSRDPQARGNLLNYATGLKRLLHCVRNDIICFCSRLRYRRYSTQKKARHSKNSGLSLNLLRCMQAALPKGN